MYFNKIYSNSIERTISYPSVSNDAHGMELQQCQPRRRQTIDHDNITTESDGVFRTQRYPMSISKQELNQRPLNNNNLMKMPANSLYIPDPSPIIVSPTPDILEER